MPRLSLLLLFLASAARLAAAHFVADHALDLPALLPAPPAADSPAAAAELGVVLQYQEMRTPELAQRAREIEGETLFSFGADVLGPWFTAEKLPQTAAFFAAVREDFITVNRTAKALWPRPRPPFADAHVKPCVEFSDTPSYPSGHGIQSSLWAALLGELLPASAAGFQKRAAETRRMKLFSGVHYPGDIEAGRLVGEALAREMLKSRALQQALATCRTELAAARPATTP